MVQHELTTRFRLEEQLVASQHARHIVAGHVEWMIEQDVVMVPRGLQGKCGERKRKREGIVERSTLFYTVVSVVSSVVKCS